MALQGVVLLGVAAANSWRLFKAWKQKKTDVSLGVFKKSSDLVYLILSSLAVALFFLLFFFHRILLGIKWSWVIHRSLVLSIIHTIMRSFDIFQHSCYCTNEAVAHRKETFSYTTCTCLNALYLMSCLLAPRSLEGAMVAITSPAELPEQHPTQSLHPFSWDCELPAHLAFHICSVSCFQGRAAFPSLISQPVDFDYFGKLIKKNQLH